ncbi:MAG: metallophosphoesterase [Polyangiaceae bacterium]
MALTAIIGDVHGCTSELEELLEQIRFSEGSDQLIFVGDLVTRGPDSRGALALVRRLGGRAVRGNHEEKLLSARHRPKSLGADHERLARALSEDEWRMLEAMPLWLDLPEHGIRVVHAGVVPGATPKRTPAEALLKIRTVDSRNRWSDEPDAGPLWGSRYDGPPHVVFGHNAGAEPQFHPWATGIDTGCVYGGRLTAVVLAKGEPMPHGRAAQTVLRSVRARRRYSQGRASAPLP